MDSEITGNTKAELLQWMSQDRRTFKWGALLAFDRATANKVFRERYVTSFNSNSYFPKISVFGTSTGSYRPDFTDCVLGEPLLAFQGSKIISSAPTCKVTLNIIGGREVVYDMSGSTVATKISTLSALNAPKLEIDLDLGVAPETGYAGVIAVDLAAGNEYRLSLGNTVLETTLSGNLFKAEIAKWSADRKKWVINRVKSNEGPFAIDSFQLRTQAAPGANARAAENYGDGAVVAFIKLVGGEAPSFPSEESQFRYLVPNDVGEGYTSTFVVNQDTYVKLLTADILKPQTGGMQLIASELIGDWQFINNVYRGNITSGAIWRDTNRHSLPGHPDSWVELKGSAPTDNFFKVGEDTGHSMRVGVGEDSRYEANIWIDSTLYKYRDVTVSHPGGGNYYVNEDIEMDHRIVAKWPITVAHGSVRVGYPQITGSTHFEMRKIGDPTNPFFDFKEIQKAMAVPLHEDLRLRLQIHEGVPISLDILPLQSFLFSEPYSTELKEVYAPRDLVMFGHLAPWHTAFELATPLHTLYAGSTHVFSALGDVTGLSYAVENLPGESTPKGSVVANTGAYTAPTVAELKGAEVRVKIKVTKGAYSTTALVTVVPRKVNVTPNIQFVTAQGSNAGYLSAGSLGGVAVHWNSDIDEERGSLKDSDKEDRDRMFVPPAAPKQGTFLDLVPVEVTAESETATAYVAVLHYPASIVISKSQLHVGNQTIRLSGEIAGDPLYPEAEWEVLVGPGRFADPHDGFLEIDKTQTFPFVLVSVKEGRRDTGYVLLPLPLAEFPTSTAAEAQNVRHITLG